MGPSWLFVWFVAVGLGSMAVDLRRGSVAVGLQSGSVAVVSDVGLSSLLICLGFLVVNMF